MKHLLLIIDGMDDEPIPAFGNLTPSYFADMPALRYMREKGTVSRRKTIPSGCIPGTEVAVLSILGHDFQSGSVSRSWFEALGAGIMVNEEDLCLRCNLISHENGIITSHSGVDISSRQCSEIIDVLNANFGREGIEFHGTRDFRCLLILRDCSANVAAYPTHTLVGRELGRLLVSSEDPLLSETLNEIIENSRSVLADYPSNGISLWAPGRPVQFSGRTAGAVIAGVNIMKGIGRAVGMTVVDVDGATGDDRTDYSAKLYAAMKALEKFDFVLLHIEAPDEASHQKDSAKKVHILEEIDRRLLSPLLNQKINMDVTVQSDHVTSSLSGQHLDWPVEVIQYKLRNSEK